MTSNTSLLGEVSDDECPLLWQHLLLLGCEPLHQLPPHHEEDRAKEGPAKDQGGVVPLEALTEDRNMTETDPPVGGGQLKHLIK